MQHKKRVIIYGLGKAFENQKFFILNEFEVVGYSDKEIVDMPMYILPKDMKRVSFDFIYITSTKYFEEIKESIKEQFENLIYDNKIISMNDILGNFQNEAARRAWIISKLKEISDGKILLDAGAGEMQYREYCKHLEYIAQDFGKYDPNEISKGLKGCSIWDTTKVNITCDIIDIPLENETVDVILCTEVLEHLVNPLLAVKEFSRILKKDGELLLTAPFCSLVHMAPYFFSSGFSEYWYRENLKEMGFLIDEILSYGNYFQWLSQELFRVNDMAKMYSGINLKEDEINIILESIKLLDKLNNEDKGSQDVLCFGYLIRAHKV